MKNHEKHLKKNGKVSKIKKKNNNIGITTSSPVFLLNFYSFGNFANFHVFHDLSTDSACPTHYCFHNRVIPAPDRLGVVDQTFTKLDMVYIDFI